MVYFFRIQFVSCSIEITNQMVPDEIINLVSVDEIRNFHQFSQPALPEADRANGKKWNLYWKRII